MFDMNAAMLAMGSERVSSVSTDKLGEETCLAEACRSMIRSLKEEKDAGTGEGGSSENTDEMNLDGEWYNCGTHDPSLPCTSVIVNGSCFESEEQEDVLSVFLEYCLGDFAQIVYNIKERTEPHNGGPTNNLSCQKNFLSFFSFLRA